MVAPASHSCCPGGFCRRHFITKPSLNRNTRCLLSAGSDGDVPLGDATIWQPSCRWWGKTVSPCTLLLVYLSPGCVPNWVSKPCCLPLPRPPHPAWVCRHRCLPAPPSKMSWKSFPSPPGQQNYHGGRNHAETEAVRATG